MSKRNRAKILAEIEKLQNELEELEQQQHNIVIGDSNDTTDFYRGEWLEKINDSKKFYLKGPAADGDVPFLHIRGSGEFKNKGFYLNRPACDETEWAIVLDSEGVNVLVPKEIL
jgi:hypothetical protein